MKSRRIERLDEVSKRTGLSPPTIYAMIPRGEFPAPVSLTPGGRSRGWLSTEIDSYIDARVAERDAGAMVPVKMPRGRPRQKRAAAGA